VRPATPLARPVGSAAHTPAQTRVIDAALALFAERGIGGTSLQMIADAIGVTKAAVYHQYHTKEEIVLAVAEVVLAGLEHALLAAESERSPARARDALIAGMIDLAIERRQMAGILQRDPVMLRCLEEHERFRNVMARVNRVIMGGAASPRTRVSAAIVASAVAGAVIHPLGRDLDDRSLRSELTRQLRKLFPQRRTSPRGSGTATSV
jgi:AcrR family transcriptional regulator